MSNQYSDWYASAQPGLTVASPGFKKAAGVDNKWYKRASIILDLAPTAFTIADIARLMTFKPNDRIVEIFVSASGGTAVAADLGIYLAGSAHDGAVVDVDRFASAITLAGTVARTERLIESTNIVDTDRGKMLWELLGLSAQPDPWVEYELAFTATATLTTADALVNVEAFGYFS